MGNIPAPDLFIANALAHTENIILDMFKIDKSMSDADVTPQYMIDNIWIVGSPDDVAAQIRGLHNYLPKRLRNAACDGARVEP